MRTANQRVTRSKPGLARRLLRGALIVGLGALLALGFTAGTASASTVSIATPERVVARVVPLSVASPVKAQTTAAPTTSDNINQQQQAANASQVKRKLIVGIAAVVLLIIVYFGHGIRHKQKLRLKALLMGKG